MFWYSHIRLHLDIALVYPFHFGQRSCNCGDQYAKFRFAGAIFWQGCSQASETRHFLQWFVVCGDVGTGDSCAIHHYSWFLYVEFYFICDEHFNLFLSQVFLISLLLPAIRALLSMKCRLQTGLLPRDIEFAELVPLLLQMFSDWSILHCQVIKPGSSSYSALDFQQLRIIQNMTLLELLFWLVGI